MDLDAEFLTVLQRLPGYVRYQRVLGLDRHDVLGEMRLTAWRAWQTWDRDRGTFNRYFWSCWHRRKIDLLEKWLAKKRPDLVFTSYELEALAPLVYEIDLLPECPDRDPVARKIWAMLGMGYERQDILTGLGISKRQYENWRLAWRRPEVRLALA